MPKPANWKPALKVVPVGWNCTGSYADARWADQPKELARLIEGTEQARQLGLRVNAGHGLTYQNVEPVAAIPGMEELNIGHTIMARALAVGLQEAVRQMRELICSPRRDPLFGEGLLLQNPGPVNGANQPER